MKAAFYTLGCKVNQYETQAMTGSFAKAGYEIVPFDSLADVYIVNTCSVTAVSDKKSRQMLRRCKKAAPDAIVVAAGCFAQLAAEELRALPEVDIVLGSANKGQLVALVQKALAECRTIYAVTDIMAEHEFENFSAEGSFEHTRAYIKIQDGCDNYCSYCTIPFARGHARSRAPEEILEEISRVAAKGYQEVILTGIEISTYQSGETNLISLLELLDKQENLPRIRLGSLEPRLVTPETASRLAQLSSLCPQFHLALQSGCDSILQRMNRKYTTAQFREALELLRQIPHATFTTDLIVGFPGETEDEFSQTLSFIETLDFLKIHVFPYSRRPGTAAFSLPGQHSKAIKTQRVHAVEQLGATLRRSVLQKQVSHSLSVLFEEEKDGMWVGYAQNYVPVAIESAGQALENCIRSVTISKTDGHQCFGTLLPKQERKNT